MAVIETLYVQSIIQLVIRVMLEQVTFNHEIAMHIWHLAGPILEKRKSF